MFLCCLKVKQHSVAQLDVALDLALSLLQMALESCGEKQGMHLIIITFYKGHVCEHYHQKIVKCLPGPQQQVNSRENVINVQD